MFGSNLKQFSFDIVFIESKDDDKEEKELPCLDRFLAKNTSEDNASFEHIMDLAKDKEKLKHSWLYEAEAEFKEVCMCTVKCKANDSNAWVTGVLIIELETTSLIVCWFCSDS